MNAAKNLAAHAVSSTVKACGGNSSGYSDGLNNETVPVKQEISIIATYG